MTNDNDDLLAVAKAAGVLREPTPEHDALAALFARIDAACDEWAAEVQALADVELAELTREDGAA